MTRVPKTGEPVNTERQRTTLEYDPAAFSVATTHLSLRELGLLTSLLRMWSDAGLDHGAPYDWLIFEIERRTLASVEQGDSYRDPYKQLRGLVEAGVLSEQTTEYGKFYALGDAVRAALREVPEVRS